MRLAELVATSTDLKATRSRTKKTALLAALLERAPESEIGAVVAWLSGELRQGRIGLGYATVFEALGATPAAADSALTVADIDAELTRIGALSGAGSGTERARSAAALFSAATPDEQRFLAGLITGELRQGALAGVMIDAIVLATGTPAERVRRAAMLSGDLPRVAEVARRDGESGLAAIQVELFVPLQPMLAQTAESPAAALTSLGGHAAFEHKLDGARIQLHKVGDRVRVFTRGLHDVTGAVPELVALGRALPAARAILDGEAIALRPDGRPHPFQTTMRRFGRSRGPSVAALRSELPLTAVFFDCLLRDDRLLLDLPAIERAQALAELVPPAHVVPRLVTDAPAEADAFLERALELGHEGIMAKDLAAPWEAGARGSGWLKVKPAFSLDLVVLAAEWGSGRRQGSLSNLHLGARDADGGFVMLGKTFKGLTDETLAWQTTELLAREERRAGHVVHVRPELVVEVAFNELQSSPRYPGGLALRFARVKGYRPDKSAHEADTMQAVRAIHAGELRLVDLVRSRG